MYLTLNYPNQAPIRRPGPLELRLLRLHIKTLNYPQTLIRRPRGPPTPEEEQMRRETERRTTVEQRCGQPERLEGLGEGK